jgi:hypothetical protein
MNQAPDMRMYVISTPVETSLLNIRKLLKIAYGGFLVGTFNVKTAFFKTPSYILPLVGGVRRGKKSSF